MRPASAASRISVWAGYERNPAGHLSPGSGGGHKATLPTPLIVIDASTGSPTRVIVASICRSRLSPWPTTFVAGLAGGSGNTVIAIESLRSVYRSSRLKNENVTGSAYSTDAGGTIRRPAASGNTTWCAMNKSIQRPLTCRESATPDDVAAG